jgi:hypothetical protein
MDTRQQRHPLAVARLTHAMTYDSPTRLIEWLIDRVAERGYAG